MVRIIEQPYVPQHLINYARYTEAITIFKTTNDPVWCASALEGLATVALLEASLGQSIVRSTVTYAHSDSAYQPAHSMPPRIPAKNLGVTFPKSLNKRSRFMQDPGLYPSLINALTYLPIFIQ
jgi:hypothetical protein